MFFIKLLQLLLAFESGTQLHQQDHRVAGSFSCASHVQLTKAVGIKVGQKIATMLVRDRSTSGTIIQMHTASSWQVQ